MGTSLKVAINGFGRIGRLALRFLLEKEGVEVVAINDLVPADNLAYLFQFDTTHGRFHGSVKADNSALLINGKKIAVFAEKNPENLPWKQLGVEYVIESTGFFTSKEGAAKHLQAGAKKVIITAPTKEEVPTIVMGVNEATLQPTDAIVSNASCTTNCLAPVCKVLLQNFGIEEALMTTVHAMTASQPVVDGPSRKDFRGGRSASQNVIPAATGAAVAVTRCLPELKGKLTGMAFRVPVANVSVVDLTVKLTNSATYDEVMRAYKEASKKSLQGILTVTEDEAVSSDFIGNCHSAIVDMKAGIALNDRFFKIIAWYDNEMAYAARVVDLLTYVAEREK